MGITAEGMSAFTIVQRYFERFDIAAHGGEQDGKISRGDLQAVADNEDGLYSRQEVEAAEYLLLNGNDYWAADVAGQDSLVGDGVISSGDVVLVLSGGDAVVDPAQVFDDPYLGSIATLGGSFDRFDAAGDNGRRDGEVTFNDLVAVAYDITGTYTEAERAAARYLLDHMEVFRQLDTAADGGEADGRISLDDVISAGGTAIDDPPADAASPQDPDLDGNGRIDSPREEHLLAMNNAPVLYFSPDDGYLLTDPDGYMAGSVVTDRDTGEVVEDPEQYLQEHPDAVLVVDPSSTGNPEPDATLTYYLYDEQTNSITYFFFYPNNDGPQSGSGAGDLQNHEGDWEQVTVQLDDQFQPTGIYLSAHGHATFVPWSQVVKENGQPVVFVAQGSHANFGLPGEYGTGYATIQDRTVSDPADATRFDTRGTTMADIEGQWWYQDGDRIHWGEERSAGVVVGIPPFTFFLEHDELSRNLSGPLGPSPGEDGKNTLAPRP